MKTLASNADINPSDGKNLLPLKMQYPWDLELISKRLYISMAGNNQIWVLNTDTGKSTILSGTGKKRNYNDEKKNYEAQALLFEVPVIYNQGNEEKRKVIEYRIQSQ